MTTADKRMDQQPSDSREPVEVPVIDDPPEPSNPLPPDTPPVPDPPEVVGFGYGSDEHYYHAEGWNPATWHSQPSPVAGMGRGAERR
jgi:hypothetical protein